MSTVALVGMGPTWPLAKESDADEIWGINFIWELEGLEPDRVYELHNLYWFRDSDNHEKLLKHWNEYITQPKDHEFWTSLHYPEIPSCNVYPIRDIIDDTLSNFHRDGEEIRFFNSTFDYLMAHAIYEGWERIELYGWAMGWLKTQSETEYRYQLPGLTFWTGLALGRGIEVLIDRETDIFKARMYEYEGGNLITRQQLESMKRAWEAKLQERQAQFHTAQGELKQMRELLEANPNNKAYQNSVESKVNAVNAAFRNLMHAEGALGMVEYQIKELDTGEADNEIRSKMVAMIKDG